MTSDFMTKQEITEAINERILQLELENISFVDTSDLNDPASIAKRELNMKKCPLILRRMVGSKVVEENGLKKVIDYYEYWDVNEMEKSVVFSNL